MAKRLFVGNLPYTADDEALRNMFSQVGEVASASIIIDRMSGRSKGFGFVEMVNDADATKAVETLNGQEVDGRKIVVNEARPMEDRPRRDFNNRGPRRDFGGDRGGNY
jgi:RNA recognition motif-containing protein